MRGRQRTAGARAIHPALLLVPPALILILLACHRLATVTLEPRGRFEDPDAAFHARRVVRTVAEGRLLPPAHDVFESFPEGGRAVWPPLHDAALALLDRLGGATRAEPEKGMRLAAAFPVLELLAALVAAASLARLYSLHSMDSGAERPRAPTAPIAAAWLFALTPVLLRRGAFGEIDHNATEVLLTLLLALAAERLSRASPSPRAAPRLVLTAIAWGGAVLLSLGFFAGLALAAAVVAGGVAVAGLLPDPAGAPARRDAAPLALGFALAALALPLFASMRVTPDPGDPWRLSPVYVLVLASAAAVTGLLSFVGRWRAAASSPSRASALAALAALVLAILLWTLAPSAAREGFARGLGFLGSRDPWLATIDEFRPALGSWTALSASLPALLVSALSLAVLPVLPSWRALLPLAVPAGAYLLLALVQKRFLPVAAALGAALAGAAWGRARAAERTRVVHVFRAVSIAGLLVALPTLTSYASELLRNQAAPSVSAGEAAGFMLAELTPAPGDPPAWGVLAPWDMGHPILRASGRPVALNNFGSFHPTFAGSLRILLETSPKRAVEELSARRLRYVVAAYPPNVVPGAAASLGLDPRLFFTDGFDPDRVARYETTAEGRRTLAVRLHERDSVPFPDDPPEDAAALARFRKLWESPETGPGPGGAPVPLLKIFELVPAS